MNFEHQDHASEGGAESELHIRNRMQIELADRYYGVVGTSTEKKLEWVDEHSVDFRNYLEKNPDTLSRFLKDHDVVLEEVERAIYDKHLHQ